MRGKHYEAKKSILQQQLISASTAHESNLSEDYDSDEGFSDGDGNLEMLEERLVRNQQNLNDMDEDQFRSILHRMHLNPAMQANSPQPQARQR